jgi:nitrogen fixation-related uncharacterized protein
MSENSIVPSMDKILSAVNSDLNDFSKNGTTQSETNNTAQNINCVFDATKWYLQNYPKVKTAKKETVNKKENIDTSDGTKTYVADDKKTSKKSGLGKTIAILIVIAVIVTIGFCLYFSYDNSQYSDIDYYDSNQIYEEDTTEELPYYDYDMIIDVGETDVRSIALNETVVYLFSPSESGNYTFYSTSDGYDFDCEVYDSYYNSIMYDTNEGDFYIDGYFEAGQKYYFVVWVCNTAGEVTVNLDQGDCYE